MTYKNDLKNYLQKFAFKKIKFYLEKQKLFN